MIYLDNAATAMPLPAAIDAAGLAAAKSFGNPSSLHAMGRQARDILEGARGAVAQALGCAPKSIVFTSGGTESANTAIQSAAAKNRRMGMHIVSTQVEHDATLGALGRLKQQGYQVTLVAPEKDGTVSADAVLGAVGDDTILVAMQAVNNETGALMPYARVASGLKQRSPRACFFLDAVQGLFKTEVALENIDFASASGHKIGGIKGAGALYAAAGTGLRPLLEGGGQEMGLRSGTEAVPAIAAFGAACQHRIGGPGTAALAALKARLLAGLDARGVQYRLNTPQEAAPHIVSISPRGGRSEIYIRVLSDAGICVSGGSACKRGRRSHVLAAMGLQGGDIDSALRISFCPENTPEEVDELCAALKQAQAMFK